MNTIKIHFYSSDTLDAKRWIYAWKKSRISHVQLELDKLYLDFDNHNLITWTPKSCWVNPNYTHLDTISLDIPKGSLRLDKIDLVTRNLKLNEFKLWWWGFWNRRYKGTDDCCTLCRRVLAVHGFFVYGSTPDELYEDIKEHYK